MGDIRRVEISSVFEAPSHDIWERLSRIETLRYIASPYASFAPLSPEEGMRWEEGAEMAFRLRIFGVLPMGAHHIRILTFDEEKGLIRSSEHNRWVPVWRHTITLAPESEGVLYTDIVEIAAGWRTGLVSWWAGRFYRHRQRRWKRLLAERAQ